jgi:hypothetical protein
MAATLRGGIPQRRLHVALALESIQRRIHSAERDLAPAVTLKPQLNGYPVSVGTKPDDGHQGELFESAEAVALGL